MYRLFYVFALLSSTSLVAQSTGFKEMYPDKTGEPFSFSIQEEMQYNLMLEECENFWRNIDNFEDLENLDLNEKKVYLKCQHDFKEYWSILDIGCSWYCGGGQDSLSASSELKPFGEINYEAGNAHDLSYKTAWVEGVDGYGIGEVLTYHVQPTNPRISEIIVVNGYVKSENAWKDNSRVKTLNVYVDDKPYAVLHLKDIRAEQHFKIAPLGYKNDGSLDKELSVWTIKFEIAEVYKGDKYEDTAITEIYFDGIDVH